MTAMELPPDGIVVLYRFRNKEWREWWFRQGSINGPERTSAFVPGPGTVATVTFTADPRARAEHMAARFRRNGWKACTIRFMSDEEAAIKGVER